MNNLNIQDNWTEKKNKIQQVYTELTDDDLKYAKGKEDDLVRRIQARLRTTEKRVCNIIRTF